MTVHESFGVPISGKYRTEEVGIFLTPISRCGIFLRLALERLKIKPSMDLSYDRDYTLRHACTLESHFEDRSPENGDFC